MSMAVKVKGAAPDNFSSGRLPMICLLMTVVLVRHTMHLPATALANLFPPGMKAVRRTPEVTSHTVLRWSSRWASSVTLKASSSVGMITARESVPRSHAS